MPTQIAGNSDSDGGAVTAFRPAENGALCPECAGKSFADQFVYSLGRIGMRFPTVAVEREFQQRERHVLGGEGKKSTNRWTRIAEVLAANDHLARAVCFVHSVGGLPAYIVTATSMSTLNALIESLRHHDRDDGWELLIGRRGPMATPTTCAGLLAPVVFCDALYSFTLGEFTSELAKRAQPALDAAKIAADDFEEGARDIFARITTSAENIGGLDSHRALNYLLVQHPGIFVATAQRARRAILDAIETRVMEAASSRRVVTVIFTFIDKATGVPERLFARVDVAEEWPFLTETAHAGAAPLGLASYVDCGVWGSTV